MGWTNYHGNAGAWVWVSGEWDGIFGPPGKDRRGRGVGGYEPLKAVKFRRIKDGLSKTCAFAEVINGFGTSRTGPMGDPKVDCFDLSSRSAPGAKEIRPAREAILAAKPRTVPWGGDWRWRGYPWQEGTVWRNWYNHIAPPDTVCYKFGDWWNMVSPASSYHDGAVNTVHCDGSVQRYDGSVDPDVWVNLGTRDGWPKER